MDDLGVIFLIVIFAILLKGLFKGKKKKQRNRDNNWVANNNEDYEDRDPMKVADIYIYAKTRTTTPATPFTCVIAMSLNPVNLLLFVIVDKIAQEELQRYMTKDRIFFRLMCGLIQILKR